jgi:hypothetical protein
MEENKRSYLIAVDIFGPELTEEVINILGEAKKVTFAPTHRVYNRIESALPSKIVDRCRDILDMKDYTKRRTVFFGHLNSHDGTREHAMALAELGYPVNVIADAMGYHSVTMTRWKIRSYAKALSSVPTLDIQPTSELIDMGFKRCQDLRPAEVKENLLYYANVGHAMVTLKSKAVSDRVEAIKKAISPEKKSKKSRWS